MTENQSDWKRKNSFIRGLRDFIHKFRIIDVKMITVAEETLIPEVKETPGETPGQIPMITGNPHYEPTGQDMILIMLTGVWRHKK